LLLTAGERRRTFARVLSNADFAERRQREDAFAARKTSGDAPPER